LLKVENYADVAMESIKAMHDQVGDLCFTSDGIAKKGVLLRHLVMPGYEEEGKKIVRWLADIVSKDLYIHVMEQYHPRAHVGKEKRGRASALAAEKETVNGESPLSPAKKQLRYADINRAVSLDEVESVRRAAEQVGVCIICSNHVSDEQD
jgi:putative pyruvate formate lyase activating enzyme